MKRTFLTLILIALFSVIGYAQFVKPTTAGSTSIVAQFSGLAYIAVNDFHGGFGLQMYLADNLSVRGSLGGVLVSRDEESSHSLDVTGALLFDIAGAENTSLYVGPTIVYTHGFENTDIYEYGGVVGARVYNVFTDGLSLGWDYPVTYSTVEGTHTWSFGKTAGNIILNLWL